MSSSNTVRVMVTQTWSWYHQQLDFPRSKWIKMHAINPKTDKSYCGLENHDDEGDAGRHDFLSSSDDCCKKCQKAVWKLRLDK